MHDESREGAPSTADAIIERAAELFAQKGFAATSIREIAEAAGVTKPTLYYYFGSKEGLIDHILRSATQAFSDNIDASEGSGSDIRTILHQLISERLGFADSHPATVNLLCRLHQTPPGETSVPDVRAMQETHLERMADVFARAMESGEIPRRDPTHLALSFLGSLAVHTLFRQRLPMTERPTAATSAHDLVELFLLGAAGAPR